MCFRIVWISVFLFVGSLGFVACGDSPTSPTSSAVTFSIVDLKVGDGDTVANGDRVQVWFTGWIYVKSAPGNKGQSFDSNRDRELFRYIVGTGHVIDGWDQGVPGMKVGGIRRLIIPSELAYGSEAQGPLPPNASLIFEIEVVTVEHPPFY